MHGQTDVEFAIVLQIKQSNNIFISQIQYTANVNFEIRKRLERIWACKFYTNFSLIQGSKPAKFSNSLFLLLSECLVE